MKKKSPMVEVKKSPWVKTGDLEPPIGMLVLWYVRGTVMAGSKLIDPFGAAYNTAFSHPMDAKFYGPRPSLCKREDFTHWRYLPNFEDQS